MKGLDFGADAKAVLGALGRSLGIIEFKPTGEILWANDNFCRLLGYQLAEIQAQHHRTFMPAEEAQSPQYAAFWAKLGRGKYDAGEYKRLGKGGREIWIQAAYNPVLSRKGTVTKIVKIASDVTQQKLAAVEFEAKLEAISRAQAVIEFTPHAEILTANENFLAVVGYRLDEIRGRRHAMFVSPGQATSPDYADFWRRLNAGEVISGEFTRIGKGDKEVWLRASYNPIFDLAGRVVKIIKFATDITDWGYAVREIGQGLSALAHNNLRYRLETPFHPAFEQLRVDFNASLHKLHDSMTEIAGSTIAIRSGAQEIAVAADDLSKRTENQAATLEETAAALSQITVNVTVSADGAQHARSLVIAADEDAKQSAGVVRQTNEAMSAISRSAQQISQIIGVIDEIAFQTNLLALNAGVEAARAGDAGRGFAVVASEVRALAQRSAEAAKEIKALISNSTSEVVRGVDLVAATGLSLERILKQVDEINHSVRGIADVAREQATAMTEVDTAIKQMDQVTQQNAAMVEETTAASHSLSAEAVKLGDLISQFELLEESAIPLADNERVARIRMPRPTGSSSIRLVSPRKAGDGTSRRIASSNWEEF